MKELDQFYYNTEEPTKSCFLALRDYILSLHPAITPEWKYKLPFFYFKGKMFCYLWKDKKTKQPYLAFMKAPFLQHPDLYLGDKKMVKKLFLNPEEDLPIETIKDISEQFFALFNK